MLRRIGGPSVDFSSVELRGLLARTTYESPPTLDARTRVALFHGTAVKNEELLALADGEQAHLEVGLKRLLVGEQHGSHAAEAAADASSRSPLEALGISISICPSTSISTGEDAAECCGGGCWRASR